MNDIVSGSVDDACPAHQRHLSQSFRYLAEPLVHPECRRFIVDCDILKNAEAIEFSLRSPNDPHMD